MNTKIYSQYKKDTNLSDAELILIIKTFKHSNETDKDFLERMQNKFTYYNIDEVEDDSFKEGLKDDGLYLGNNEYVLPY